jgi:hypothetical protein
VSITDSALQAVVTVTDGDGDTATTSADIGAKVQFLDDGPTIGPIANSIVDFAAGATATKSLNGAVGADQNTAPYTIDSFTSSITINGTALEGILSPDKETVTYFADTSGDGIFGDANDTAFYQLVLNQTGAGSYTFTVLVNPPPAVLAFDFNSLHSGSNLFGTVGDVNNALIVIAENPVINPADGTLVSSPNGVIKTSQGGGPTTIGVNSQMFDPGEGAYFTYVKNPDPNFLGSNLSQTEANDADNIVYNGGTNPATSASTTISQIQGNSLATMKITAYDIADSPQKRDFVSGLPGGPQVSITSVHVFDASGNDVTGNKVTLNADGSATVSGLDAGFTIAWTTSAPHDRVLIEGVAGKFDIGGFTITQPQPTPDQKLDFVARATDGDGDFATASFSIGIDGTGVFHDGHVAGVG